METYLRRILGKIDHSIGLARVRNRIADVARVTRESRYRARAHGHAIPEPVQIPVAAHVIVAHGRTGMRYPSAQASHTSNS